MTDEELAAIEARLENTHTEAQWSKAGSESIYDRAVDDGIALVAEVRRMRAIIAGRTAPPSDAEIAACAAQRGKWYVGASVGGEGVAGTDKAREWAAMHRQYIAEDPEGHTRRPWRWIAVDRDSRPCAWPVP